MTFDFKKDPCFIRVLAYDPFPALLVSGIYTIVSLTNTKSHGRNRGVVELSLLKASEGCAAPPLILRVLVDTRSFVVLAVGGNTNVEFEQLSENEFFRSELSV